MKSVEELDVTSVFIRGVMYLMYTDELEAYLKVRCSKSVTIPVDAIKEA